MTATRTFAQISSDNLVRLSGCYIPGTTWAAPGMGVLWLDGGSDPDMVQANRLKAWLRTVLGSPFQECSAPREVPQHMAGQRTVWVSEDLFFELVNFLQGAARVQSADRVYDGPSGEPFPFQEVAPELALYAHLLRLGAALVDAGDVLAFAAPRDTSWPDVEAACFALARLGDEDLGYWASHTGMYAAAWSPAWSDARHRALRMLWVSLADEYWREAWFQHLPWQREEHSQLLAELWVWRTVNRLMRRFGRAVGFERLDSGNPYRVLYRGEEELVKAWVAAIQADSPFSADGWLVWRTLRQAFAQSGWRREWLLSRSGEAYYHLELELLPPSRESVADHWRLVCYVAHNHWDASASLGEWWLQPDRRWRIGREVLLAPDEWVLPKLREAGQVVPALGRALAGPAVGECELAPDDVYAFLTEQRLQLEALGVSVRFPDVSNQLADARIRVRVKRVKSAANRRSGGANHHLLSADQLLEFDWTLVVGDEELAPEEFERLVEERTPYVRVGGSWRLVPIQEILEQVEQLRVAAKGKSSVQTLDLLRTVLMNQGDDRDSVALDVSFAEEESQAEEVLTAFLAADCPTLLPEPAGFRGTLRDYQRFGYSWLYHLRSVGCGGVLADDMGLGKTVQVLAYLQYLKESGKAEGVHLLVCPTSLLQNWRAEINRFTPELRAYVHHGADRGAVREDGRTALEQALTENDLVLTTYATVVRDFDVFEHLSWDVVVADEAQNIKNPETRQAQAVCALKANQRIALTGTPIENRLEELWSIFHFTNPGYLGGAKWFRKTFVQPLAVGQDKRTAERLQRLLRPVLLRRSKTNPLIRLELPEKWESVQYAALTAEQAALYQSIVNQLFATLPEEEGIRRRGHILAALVRLKQVCDHPCLAIGGSGSVERSGKLKMLLDLLETVVSDGESALVFTQFRDMGALLCDALAVRFGWKPKFLHGGLSAGERGRIVEDFQSGRDPAQVLVLSLKAGGVGLNLTRANHVFHFDRWWNPAVEDQATDRAFRIGQVKDVQVHKLVCPGTLEERIDELIQSKRNLSSMIVGNSEAWITELDNDALQELFALDVRAALEAEEWRSGM